LVIADGSESPLTDPDGRVWLVLGGGGLKGLGHIGAWRALSEAGVRLSGIVGTSIGALLAVNFAAGARWENLRERALDLKRTDLVRINRRVVWVNGIRQPSVFRGDVLRSYYESQIPTESWDSLDLPCQINATSLRSGQGVWFGKGGRTDVSILDAVQASSALPVLYPPVQIDDDHFVDGGATDMLGLDRAADLGATRIIAIDTGSGGDQDPDEVVKQGLVGIQQRLFAMMTSRRRAGKLAAWCRVPVTLVRPKVDGYGVFDFDQIEYFIEEGYRATVEALA